MITEYDIFLYCTSRDNLERTKIFEIEANLSQYVEFIELVEASISGVRKFKDDEIDELLVEKICGSELNSIISAKNSKVENKLHLAASITELNPTFESQSFIDSKRKFLVRVVKTEKMLNIYVYPEEELKYDYKLQILPSGKEFLINKNNLKIITEDEIIQKINIKQLN